MYENSFITSCIIFTLTVDASKAGAGNLEIIVSVAGENVPNFVKAEGNAKFEVSCTPQVPDTHMISVKFNGEIVPGKCVFFCNILNVYCECKTFKMFRNDSVDSNVHEKLLSFSITVHIYVKE